jgi:TetR/AcrR family transcriptional regulator
MRMRRQVADRKRTRRGREAEGTREALLRAATELFALHGFDGATVEDVARAARVNKALISYHFRGKRGLYLAILRSTLAAGVERMAALNDGRRRAPELLSQFLTEFHRLATVDRPFFPALLLREVLAAGRTFDEEIVPEILALFRIVREILERGAAEGSFRRVNPFLAHIGIIGSLAFFYATEPNRRRIASQGRLPVPLPSSDEFLRHMQEMVIRGLTAETPEAGISSSNQGGSEQ